MLVRLLSPPQVSREKELSELHEEQQSSPAQQRQEQRNQLTHLTENAPLSLAQTTLWLSPQ
ncbi:hypothetical protein FACS1894198_4830 [Clostridia bacterium]|nr:hypothetical protein FACS1894198_4830 [Clostridia bacterium]